MPLSSQKNIPALEYDYRLYTSDHIATFYKTDWIFDVFDLGDEISQQRADHRGPCRKFDHLLHHEQSVPSDHESKY